MRLVYNLLGLASICQPAFTCIILSMKPHPLPHPPIECGGRLYVSRPGQGGCGKRQQGPAVVWLHWSSLLSSVDTALTAPGYGPLVHPAPHWVARWTLHTHTHTHIQREGVMSSYLSAEWHNYSSYSNTDYALRNSAKNAIYKVVKNNKLPQGIKTCKWCLSSYNLLMLSLVKKKWCTLMLKKIVKKQLVQK